MVAVLFFQLFLLFISCCSGLDDYEKGTEFFRTEHLKDRSSMMEKSSNEEFISKEDIQTFVRSLHQNYLMQTKKMQREFGRQLNNQAHRLRILENKVAEQERFIFKLLQDSPEPDLSHNDTHTQVGEPKISHKASTNTNIRNASFGVDEKKIAEKSSKPINTRKERLLTQPVSSAGGGVAFYAYMSNSISQSVAAPHHVFIFDNVRTNIGDGYHPSTGVFIVPETGMYVFTWTFLNRNGNVHSVQLMVNSNEWGILHLHTDSTTAVSATGIVVAHVNKGDDVFVKTSGVSSGEIYSGANSRTSFAGWKLF